MGAYLSSPIRDKVRRPLREGRREQRSPAAWLPACFSCDRGPTKSQRRPASGVSIAAGNRSCLRPPRPAAVPLASCVTAATRWPTCRSRRRGRTTPTSLASPPCRAGAPTWWVPGAATPSVGGTAAARRRLLRHFSPTSPPPERSSPGVLPSSPANSTCQQTPLAFFYVPFNRRMRTQRCSTCLMGGPRPLCLLCWTATAAPRWRGLWPTTWWVACWCHSGLVAGRVLLPQYGRWQCGPGALCTGSGLAAGWGRRAGVESDCASIEHMKRIVLYIV